MEPSNTEAADEQQNSTWGIFLILAGLIAIGVAAGYRWLRGLPK
jgi:hypothetical protein